MNFHATTTLIFAESVTLAAKLLSMSHGSLSDWLARRTLPRSSQTAASDDDED